MADDNDKPPAPPVIDGAPPAPEPATVINTTPKRVDSLGRSLDKPRGRKPAQGARSQSNADMQQKIAAELGKRMPEGTIMSDENVGKAIAGAFGAIGIFAGPHWRLMQTEEKAWGAAFGPLARIYGPEELAKWIMVLMVLPVITETIGPRIAIQQMIYRGELPKDQARGALLQVKGMMAAEAELNVEAQIAEQKAMGAAFLHAQVKAAHEATAELKGKEVAATVAVAAPEQTVPVQTVVPEPAEVDWGDTDPQEPAKGKPN